MVAMEHEPPHREADAMYQALLEEMGLAGYVDEDTATRYVRSLRQLTHGVNGDPDRHLQVTFPPATVAPILVSVANIPYVSVCEHHMLPFWGAATIAYLPCDGAKIVGLSKIARCFQEHAARPQIQERLGQQMLNALTGNLDISGAAIAITGFHTCMALRGVQSGTDAKMITVSVSGKLEHDPWRSQFQTIADRVLTS